MFVSDSLILLEKDRFSLKFSLLGKLFTQILNNVLEWFSPFSLFSSFSKVPYRNSKNIRMVKIAENPENEENERLIIILNIF